MPGAIATAGELHALDCDAELAALGTHPSALPVETLAEGFDFVIQGEGPLTIAALLASRGNRDRSKVPGLWYLAGAEFTPMHGPRAPLIASLGNVLPRQAWERLDMTRYRAHGWHVLGDLGSIGSYASVQTSLGCNFSCEFCCINAPFGGPGTKMRYWPVETIVAQLEELATRFGIVNVKFPDEMFVLSPRRVIEICTAIEELQTRLGHRFNFWAYARVDTLRDPRMLDALKSAGFNWLAIGIESGSKLVRDGVEKGRFGNLDIVAAVRAVEARGIHVLGNYIFGLPDDTLDSMRETLTLASELRTPWANFYCGMAYPGSPLHAKMRGKGMLPEENGVGWGGYAQHARRARPLSTETLDYREVLDCRDRAFVSYFSDGAYRASLLSKFGPRALTYVDQMLSIPLEREHRQKTMGGELVKA